MPAWGIAGAVPLFLAADRTRNPKLKDASVASSGWPDATNTGVPSGTTLVRVPQDATSAAGAVSAGASGNTGWSVTTVGGQSVLNVTSSNAVLNQLDCDYAVYNNGGQDARTALAVTITKCKIRGQAEHNWGVVIGPGSLVQDCEIGDQANANGYGDYIGILAGRWDQSETGSTVQRCNIHHLVHGMRVDGDTTVLDSWIHHLPMGDGIYGPPGDPGEAHSDGIMCTAGTNVVIQHNRFSHGNTAPFFIQWQTGNVQIGSWDLNGNKFEAVVGAGNEVASYAIAIENKGMGSGTKQIRNNVFDRLNWGTVGTAGDPIECTSSWTLTNNRYIDGAQEIVPVTIV